ncbi:DNA methyltransferase [Thiobacillus sedimenti]|uniref:site-specific DNA-methyltransferase (adenine-specific) n=1 Tax=Thiobacillus sedimenti TaxID=3110231 RepID=A0ABZ1CJM7_9PROT|nr:DNA methyltransferase [Thiobacillus sp. SCUT-2]WRS39584.1 DNA methyltransferase [Thiobacillus sp. SCUT-2]
MPLSWNEIKSRALAFSREWADASSEDSEAKPFWIAFFEIFGITNKRVATFEHAVKKFGGDQGYVDLFWPGMLLVEQKSRGKNLDRAFNQALDYFPGIKERDLPRHIVVCDFARFRLYDLESGDTREFALKDLHKYIRHFGFVAGYETQDIKPQNPVNIRAAEHMGRLHDALKASGYDGHALEVLLVRLLFCLFADDTGIFQPAQALHTYIEERTREDGSDLGPLLAQLFQVLNTPEPKRSPALDEQLAAFPYVNGRLFEEAIPIADFDSAMREALLDACALDWSAISPAIFGALFQSIMDKTARRNLGAHYTSEENILKLIKPLFLDVLWDEFHKVKKNRNRLFEFHKKLRSLTFFDPACGCGNFLVIAYRELRLLELEILRASNEGPGSRFLDIHQAIQLDVDQFHGIEIEEFPAQIAQVALWLVDHQMNLRVGEEFGMYFARIPLKTSPHIVHGNALTLDWNNVLPAERASYVMSNPPFIGKQHQSAQQKSDAAPLFARLEGGGVLDFVAAWYIKAAAYSKSNPGVVAGFVSTNSIVQGEQVGSLWGWMLAQGMHIHFAHRTFRWSNEARGKAAVHCVIIGFARSLPTRRVIYEYDDLDGEPHATIATNINPYLVDAPDVALPSRRTVICDVPPIVFGSMANDGGHLFLNDAEKEALLSVCPAATQWIRPFLGADEFINNIPRWCLWLEDCPPAELRAMPAVMERVQKVKAHREASSREATRALAATPALFGEIRQPTTRYLLVPCHSSERREFIPIGFLSPQVIVGNANLCIPDATLFHFGVMTSRMHMAWVKYVCGRLESRYRYTGQIVYNNFPWPDAPDDKTKLAIETAAQAVLDARAAFPGASLADLYDPLTMPPALLRAHQKLDAAVDKAYGKSGFKSDAERVAFLFQRYQVLTSLLPAVPVKRGKKTTVT